MYDGYFNTLTIKVDVYYIFTFRGVYWKPISIIYYGGLYRSNK